MLRPRLVRVALLCGAGVLFCAADACATTYNWQFTGTCSEACNAEASITPGAGTLTVVLTDLEVNPRSAGDLLSGIELGGLGGTPTLFSQAGQLITVSSANGPYTISSGPPTHWGVGATGGNVFLETAGSYAAGGQPINMIIGPADTNGNYSSSNNSINDGHFSPYIDGAGTFVLDLSGITAASNLTDLTVDLLFGTTPDYSKLASFIGTSNQDPLSTPLPGAFPLFVSGLGGLALLRLRRKRKPVSACA